MSTDIPRGSTSPDAIAGRVPARVGERIAPRRMLRRGALAATLALLMALPLAAQAFAASESASRGSVEATLSYPDDDPTSADPELLIVRGDQTLYNDLAILESCGDQPCQPLGSGGFGSSSIFVRQIDATPDPEVVLSMYSGGAHCCFIAQVWRLTADSALVGAERSFGNPGFRLRDGDGDGVSEFWSADDRFAYRFASYASSGLPLRVFAYARGGFRDVTAGFPREIAADAARWWRYYRRAGSSKSERLGLLAAWAADQYRLGRRSRAIRTIRRELRARRIAKRSWNGRPFLRDLDRFLGRLRY